jgi:DNA-binding response OmpR family regulator
LNLSLKSASRDGHAINLSPTCWKILELLMRESPKVVSRQKIEASIWGDDVLPETNALKVHLYNLRQKVDKPFGNNLIHTITPHGFAFRNDE